MRATERLDDLLPQWRKFTAPDLSRKAEAIAKEAVSELPAQTNTDDPAFRQGLKDAVTVRVIATTVEMVPQLIGWLEGMEIEVRGTGRLGPEVELSLRQWMPPFKPYLPRPESRIPVSSLAIAAAVGAALGAVVLGPLSLLVLGQREPGLFAGGLLGAALTVGLLSWLSRQPKILNTLQMVVGSASLISALAGVVSVIRSRSMGLLKGAAWISGCWVVLLLARPKAVGPTPKECSEALQPQVEQLLAQSADSALALVICHPDRVVVKANGDVTKKQPVLPTSLVDAIVVLDSAIENREKSSQLLEPAIRVVIQRVRSLGYQWRVLPKGTLYTTALEEQFDCYDLITDGQPVETLEPPVLCNGELLKRGKLRSVVE
jgi:hypothetical protein